MWVGALMPGANPEGKDQRRPAVFAADEIYTKNQEEMQCQYIYVYIYVCTCICIYIYIHMCVCFNPIHKPRIFVWL